MTMAELAGEAYAQFERRTRDDDGAYYALKDGAPDWLHDLVREAHGDMFPDDWRYEAIHSALSDIHDSNYDDEYDAMDGSGEFADGNVDTYNGERAAWLASHLSRAGYVDQARDDGLIAEDADIYDRIGVGQYAESEEVYASVVQSLQARLDELED